MPIRRRRPPVTEFVGEFQEGVIPSAIPMSDFIDWERIERELANYQPQIEALDSLRNVSEDGFITGLADALSNAEDTREWIDFYFDLLGHSGTKYAALEGLWRFYDIQRAIDSGDRDAARDLGKVLQEIGLQYLVDTTDDISAHFRGMKVGMESHKRKNRGGDCFEQIILEELETITQTLRKRGHRVEVIEQHTTQYQDESGQSKVVDFAIMEDDEPRVVFEANCYTASGSKPSEIKRSYDRVSTRMRQDGIECVWITDGQAWETSLGNVLKEAYRDIVDLYNLEMVQTELEDDVLAYFEQGAAIGEDEVNVEPQQTFEEL
ncbi:type II restriction endonuclease [Halomicroarcula limicola]|uniref:Type II restriction endonuclease n=2 Tax=Haloarcula limicola TaxID=1429915 RepID=A0A8J7YCP8_9EURY|nr:DpnII family type II restriction endonuclease [Halomicroarcula limicola]MBV0926221.1 type II restriction endonuclease [Halomicroarcula limicola]